VSAAAAPSFGEDAIGREGGDVEEWNEGMSSPVGLFASKSRTPANRSTEEAAAPISSLIIPVYQRAVSAHRTVAVAHRALLSYRALQATVACHSPNHSVESIPFLPASRPSFRLVWRLSKGKWA
jgi:hypothetical protein